MINDQKHTKHTTKLYVEHACNHIGTNGVADLLKLPATRISEMKTGKRHMSFNEAEIIRSEFGLPSISSGRYVEGELLGLNWQQTLAENSRVLHFIRAIEAINGNEFLDYLLSLWSVNCWNIEGYNTQIHLLSDDEKEGAKQKNNRLEREEKFKLIRILFENEAFKQWLTQVKEPFLADYDDERSRFEKELYEFKLEDGRGLNEIFEEIEAGFHVSNPGRQSIFAVFNFIMSLYRVINAGTYAPIINGETKFILGKKYPINEKLLPIKEYVVTGRDVWRSEFEVLETFYQEQSGLGWVPDIRIHRGIDRLDVRPRRYEAIAFTLIYSENHNYFVQVILQKKMHVMHEEGNRILLIEIQDRRNVFQELCDIFDWFKVKYPISVNNIKASLAKNGAYIPNAVYLN